MRNASGMLVAPERRTSSPVITKIAAGAAPTRSLCFEGVLTRMLLRSSKLSVARCDIAPVASSSDQADIDNAHVPITRHIRTLEGKAWSKLTLRPEMRVEVPTGLEASVGKPISLAHKKMV